MYKAFSNEGLFILLFIDPLSQSIVNPQQTLGKLIRKKMSPVCRNEFWRGVRKGKRKGL